MNNFEIILKEMVIPITDCHINCKKCNMPVDFRMFESGNGGDFKTIFGKYTHNYYRIDLSKIRYSQMRIDDVQKVIEGIEGGKANIFEYPEQLKCAFCKTINDGNETIFIDNEQTITAIVF